MPKRVQRADYSVRFLAAAYDYAAGRVGCSKAQAVIREQGLTEEYIRDPSHWVSQATFESTIDAFVSVTRDPNFVWGTSRLLFEGRYLGLLRLVLQFGSLERAYADLPEAAKRWDKAGNWTLVDLDKAQREVVLRYTNPNERSQHMCTGRAVQIRAMPGLWGLAPATIEHPQCIHRGDGYCEYNLRWPNAPSPVRQALPLALTVGGGVAFALGTWGLGWALAWVLGGATAMGWVAVVSHLHQTDALQQRTHQILERQDMLTEVVVRNEARYQELHEASEALQVALEWAQRASDAKSTFLATMSHELRTPINAILGYTELVLEDLTDPDAKADLGQVVQASNHLLGLIDDVLDLTRVESGLWLQPEPTELAQITSEAMRLVDPMATSKGLVTSVSVPTGLMLMVDPRRLRQVVLNLLSNAVKFTEHGTVSVVARQEHNRVILAVCDTGCGIAPEHQQAIFDQFVQVDGSSTREHGGAGLGLAVSHAIVDAMGGTLHIAESEVGVGSRFEVDLPLDKATRPGNATQPRI